MEPSLHGDSWRDDLADRFRYCADLIDCAVLAGRVRFTVYVGKLAAIGARLRGLAAEARSTPRAAELELWRVHIAEEARELGIRLRVVGRLRVCAEEGAHEDLVLVASELAVIVREAEADSRPTLPIRALGGAP